ncbi:hypothetical protein KIN20_027028 [Parelaphostrongylus tenuis]|uniref:Mitochondrial import inner membrane translocase subunit n=1 Tax=Parelaphostrongylus tenuis TaxID=148309 RepID=A0AAD5QZ37_PARTN|nr:hypothetical protein KIN20_027027 [Parelaphostrongylus tenuis]KAJ1366388.1 hypothetical protein KIN20_027028 [Parelaphostrongylus tenuis]
MTTRAASDTDLETFRDFLIQYNKVTEQCFGSCVNDFTVRSVTKKEEKCSLNCLDKFLKMTQRLSFRFQCDATSPILLSNFSTLVDFRS